MKKVIALMLAMIMALSLCSAGFASGLEGTYDITVWVAEKMVDLTRSQIDAFNASNEFGSIQMYSLPMLSGV